MCSALEKEPTRDGQPDGWTLSGSVGAGARPGGVAMKVAVLSDIHGNLEALEAVRQDLLRIAPEKVICLGDLVGYGPDPEAVVTRVRAWGYGAIRGNHEAALASKQARDWMNFQAKENNIVTETLLSADSLQYCRELPLAMSIDDALFVHGFPPDSVNAYLYLMPDDKVVKTFAEDSRRFFFVGHTHELMLVYLQDGKVVREHLAEGVRMLSPEHKYLINCGSVGQPRDRDRRAKYLVWDSEAVCLEVRAVSYDVETTAEKIVRCGFPKSYADRLR